MLEQDVQESDCEEEDGDHNCRRKEHFFDAALRAVHVSFATEGSGKTGALRLQQDSRNEENRESEKDAVEEIRCFEEACDRGEHRDIEGLCALRWFLRVRCKARIALRIGGMIAHFAPSGQVCLASYVL